ncbi:MAG: hypothetical protein ACRELU_08160 [Gemmatimonadota bacterium]
MIWSPQLDADQSYVPGAARLMSDSRATHYWDPQMLVGNAFRGIVHADQPLWDFWMLFDRTARWKDAAPPAPAWWEHQLRGLPEERHLEPDRFGRMAARLLDSSAP